MVIKGYNKWDYLIIIIITSLLTGVLGGVLQLTRIISVLLILPNIYILLSNKISLLLFCFINLGLAWILIGFILIDKTIDAINPIAEWTYLILYLNIVLSLLLASRFAINPINSIIQGWRIFFFISIPIALVELLSNHHFPTNETQTLLSESGKKLNGIENKRYAAYLFNNYNEYMTCLSFGLPFFCCSLQKLKNIKDQLFTWLIIFITGIIILITASRGALACYVICVLLTIRNYKHIDFNYKKTLLRLICIFGGISILLFSGVLFAELISRSESMSGNSVMEDLGRLAIYQSSWEGFVKTNYVGMGPYGLQDYNGFATHNMWLEILCQYGWFIFLPVMIMLIYLYKRTLSNMKKGSLGRSLLIMFILILPFASIINSGYLIFSFFWVSLGCILTFLFNQLSIKNENFN